MKKTFQRGFTLIELLVVIAIIGILAAVVLASLNDARRSGSDAAIKQSLGNARSQAEIVYNRNGVFSYANVCADANINQLIDAAHNNSGSTGAVEVLIGDDQAIAAGASDTICHSDPDEWVISAPLASSNAASTWCVDSNGFVGSTTNPVAGGELECEP